MIIHVVTETDTIDTISKLYELSPTQIIEDNQLINPNQLIPGQDLLIRYTAITHQIEEGETLHTIAALYHTSIFTILQHNPTLSLYHALIVGDTITIEYNCEKLGDLSVFGYAYPYINASTLDDTLPYLTYLGVYAYGFTPTGNLVSINDEAVVSLAREYGVAPIMVLSLITDQGVFNSSLGHSLLTSEEAQQTLLSELLQMLQQRNYYGLNLDFDFIYEEDADAFSSFVAMLREKLNLHGFELMVSLAPKTYNQGGVFFQCPHDYKAIGEHTNYALLSTYEWGATFSPPKAHSPINVIRDIVTYTSDLIPTQKIFLGIPNYAYDWTLPYIKKETKAKSLPNQDVIKLALKYGGSFHYDTKVAAPYYEYVASDGTEHIVWFENARSLQEKLELTHKKKLHAVSFWNIMQYYPQYWITLSSLMNIRKVF